MKLVLTPELSPHYKEVNQFIHRLHHIHWFTNIGKAHQLDNMIERISLKKAKETHFVPVIRWYGAESAIDTISEIELSGDREKIFEVLPEPVYDIVWDAAEEFSLFLHWDVSKMASITALFAAQEIALKDLCQVDYFQKVMYWYFEGYFPCGMTGDGKMIVL